MYIKLEKETINKIKKLMYDNPNREIGIILKEDRTFNVWYGKKYRVVIPKIVKDKDNGIFIHTHPINNQDKYDNDPPSSNIDFMCSIFNHPKNDKVVFDKSGIWVYRPNNFLNSLEKYEDLINHIKEILNLEWDNLSDKKIDIDTYLQRISKLSYHQKYKKYIGFNIKYYSYNNIKDINLKYTT